MHRPPSPPDDRSTRRRVGGPQVPWPPLGRALIRYWWLGLAVWGVVACAGFALALLQQSEYEATAQVLIAPNEELGSNVQAIEFTIPTLAEQARTAEISEAARRRLPSGLAERPSSVSIRPNSQTLTLDVTASSTSREVVVPLANAYADQIVQRQGDGGLVSLSLLRPASSVNRSPGARPVLVVAGIAMGAVLGLFAILAVSARLPRASRPADLRAIGLRALGTVSSSSRPGQGGAALVLGDQVDSTRVALRLDGLLVQHGTRAFTVVGLEGASTWLAESMARGLRECGRSAATISDLHGPGPSTGGRLRRDLDRASRMRQVAVVSCGLPAGTPAVAVATRETGAVVLALAPDCHRLEEVEAVAREFSAEGVEILGAVFATQPSAGSRGRGAPPESSSLHTPRPPSRPQPSGRAGPRADEDLPELGSAEQGGGPSRTQTTAKNAGFVFIQTGLPPLLNVLLLPILVRELGPVGYGLFAAFQSVFILNSLFDLGLSKSIVRYTATYFAASRYGAISRFVSTAFTVFLGLGAIAMSFAVLFAAFGLSLIGVPATLHTEAVIACLVFGFAGLYNLPAGTLGGVMGGLKLHSSESKIHVSVAIVQAAAMATAALSGAGLVAVVLAFHLPNFVKPWIRLPLIRRALPEFKISPRLFDRSVLREMGTYSVWAFLVDSGRRIVESIDPIIVSAFIGLATVTPYAIGLQVGRLLQRMTLPIAFVLLPVASELEARGDRATTQRLILRATRYTCALALGLALPLIIMAEDVIRVWLGERYPLAVDVSRIFLVVSVILMVRAPLVNVLESSHRGVRYAGMWVLVESALNIILSLILLHPFGARGIVLSTLLAVSIGTLLGIGPAALRMYTITPWAVMRASILPNMVPVLVAAPVWLGAAWLAHERGLFVVLGALFTSVGFYLLVLWRTLPEDDRRDLGGPLRRKLGLGRASTPRPQGASNHDG